ncbi:lipid IV(A) 3-deoxy-D-manno-octulosonic acid transferase [Halomonas sp. WWR20]
MSAEVTRRVSWARWLYSAALYALSPLIWWRVWREWAPTHPRRERLGIVDCPHNANILWLHAASVGEVLAAKPLIDSLCTRYPDHCLVITTMTATGAERVQTLFPGDHFPVVHHFLPLDFPGAARRFLQCLQPRLAIIVETELWPNLMAACSRQGVPVIVANARLSPRGFAGYRRVRALMAETLSRVDWLAAKSGEDAQRFIALGLPAERAQVVGSIKYDLSLDRDTLQRSEHLRARMKMRPVWVAGSTHPGEDERILEAHALLRETYPDALLILVPRHPQRFEAVYALCQAGCEARDERVARRSLGQWPTPATSVLLGDTMGELMAFYGAADVAFVGGSLVDIGGHNLLEPAACGVPVITGPHLSNFQDIADTLRNAGALVEVSDARTLGAALVSLLGAADERERLGRAGEAVVAANRGALARTLAGIDARLASAVRT